MFGRQLAQASIGPQVLGKVELAGIQGASRRSQLGEDSQSIAGFDPQQVAVYVERCQARRWLPLVRVANARNVELHPGTIGGRDGSQGVKLGSRQSPWSAQDHGLDANWLRRLCGECAEVARRKERPARVMPGGAGGSHATEHDGGRPVAPSAEQGQPQAPQSAGQQPPRLAAKGKIPVAHHAGRGGDHDRHQRLIAGQGRGGHFGRVLRHQCCPRPDVPRRTRG